MLSSSQSHAAITNYCRNGETAVRQRSCSSRTNEINNRDREIGPVQSAMVYLIAGGQAGSVAATGGDSVGVSQTDAGRPLAQLRPLGWSFMGRRQARIVSRNRCHRRGGGGMECDPLVGLMLAGQQSRPCPGTTVRRWRGN